MKLADSTNSAEAASLAERPFRPARIRQIKKFFVHFDGLHVPLTRIETSLPVPTLRGMARFGITNNERGGREQAANSRISPPRMSNTMSLEHLMQSVMEGSAYLPQPDLPLTVRELTEPEKAEVLGFLSERPIHTVIMMGMIRDNGIVSELNRGKFYGCRNSEGRLEAVGVIGHATLIEARTRTAVQAMARTTQMHDGVHMFMAEQEIAEEFWNVYADDGQAMRFDCRGTIFSSIILSRG